MSKLKTTAGIKKLFRILFFFLAGIALFLVLAYIALRTPYVQTYLVQYVTERIERTTGVKIQVGGVDFRPMSSLVLKEVLLKDFRNDTLLYCQDLSVKVDSFRFVDRSFTIKDISLDRAYFNLWITRGVGEAGGSVMNLDIFLDSLLGKQQPGNELTQKKKSRGWLVGLNKVNIRNSRFVYQENEKDTVDYGVNWTDVDCRDLNVEVSGFEFGEDETRLVVSGLTLREKSGLYIKELDGRLLVRSGNMVVTDGRIVLDKSDVDLIKLEFNWTPNQRDWRYFVTRMQQYYELGPSSVSFIDLAYFNGILRGIYNTVLCSGVVSNTVDKIEGRDIHIQFGDKSILQGDFKSVGLPDVMNTFFDIRLHDSHVNPEDLESVYLPWFGMNIPLPQPLHQLQYIDLDSIRFQGTLSDFKVKARSVTPDLKGELTFAYSPCGMGAPDCSAMAGTFNFSQVNCSKLSGTNIFGNGAVSGRYDGKLENGDVSMNLKSNVRSLKINKGEVKNMEFFLSWMNDRLDVMSWVKNDDVHSEVVLSYDMSDTLKFMSARGYLDFCDLSAFGISYLGHNESISTSFDLVYALTDNNVGFGNLGLSRFRYANSNGAFSLDSVSLETTKNGDYNMVNLYSDVADLSIDGNYRDIRPMDFVSKLFRSYLPAYAEKGKKKGVGMDMNKVDFQYDINVKDLNRVLKVVFPDLSVSPGANISSYFKYGDEQISMTLLADTVQYKDIRLVQSKVDMKGDAEQLRIMYAAEQVRYNDGYQLYNVRNELSLRDNLVNNRLTWSNWGRSTYCGELAASILFKPDAGGHYTTEINVKPGVIVMADTVWHVKKSSIFIKGKSIDINDFSINRGRQHLSVKGKISENPGDKLFIDLSGFDLTELNRLVFPGRLQVFGNATGNMTIQDYYKDRLLASDFNIENWGLNQDTLGSLHLRSYWDVGTQSVIIGAENSSVNAIPLQVSGYYIPGSDSLDVDVRLSKVRLERLSVYASEYVSAATGGLTGRMNITGTMSRPDISGFLHLDSVGLKVNNLNTDFFINDRIHIKNNRLLFRDFVVRDAAGHPAAINGDFLLGGNKYGISVKLENFLLLNTDFSHNESFYGRVHLSGLTELNNDGGITNLIINARTEDDSKLFIPLTAGMSEQSNNFLHFVSSNQPAKKKAVVTYTNNSINLDANLEVNDNLDVQVIFDPTVGDILKTSGKGDLRITLDKEGSLNMFGEYKISKGDYLFTLSNLLNKKFVLKPGGTIAWSGSPYDATLDIGAVYNLKTSLNELLTTSADETDREQQTTTDKGKKVPVECVLNLSDHLTNPVVKFDINFPTLETQTRSYIQSLFSSQDEINKQMFSLLVLNRFYRTDNSNPLNFGAQAGTAGVTTVTEMMSSQLSRWLSQISNNFDVGLSYRVGDEITTDEIEVALSTQLLNDRVTLSANGNMDVGGTKNTATGKSSNTSNIAGDFDLDVKLNKQGTLKLKAYSHTDEKIIYNNTETIQGVGISYQESFDTVKELFYKYLSFFNRKKDRTRGSATASSDLRITEDGQASGKH